MSGSQLGPRLRLLRALAHTAAATLPNARHHHTSRDEGTLCTTAAPCAMPPPPPTHTATRTQARRLLVGQASDGGDAEAARAEVAQALHLGVACSSGGRGGSRKGGEKAPASTCRPRHAYYLGSPPACLSTLPPACLPACLPACMHACTHAPVKCPAA